MPAATWLLAFLVAYYVAGPLLTLTHELGHALVRLADPTARVSVEVGRQPPLARVRIGRLTLQLRPWPSYLGFVRSEHDRELSKLHRVVEALAGPVVSGVDAAALIALAVALDDPARPFAAVAAWFAAYQFVVTIVPMTYPDSWGGYAGLPSDGLRAVRILRPVER